MDGSQRGDLTAGAGRYSGRAIQRDRLALAGGRLCPVVAWGETRPALECASERARLGKPEREGDVGDGAARVFDVAQGEVLARIVDELEVGRLCLGEPALQGARAHVEPLRRIFF